MPSDNSVTIGDHFSEFVKDKINEGRFESVSEMIRAGLRLLETEEARLELVREKLSNEKPQAEEARLELLHEKLSNDMQQAEGSQPELSHEKISNDMQQADKGEMLDGSDFMHGLTDFRK